MNAKMSQDIQSNVFNAVKCGIRCIDRRELERALKLRRSRPTVGAGRREDHMLACDQGFWTSITTVYLSMNDIESVSGLVEVFPQARVVSLKDNCIEDLAGLVGLESAVNLEKLSLEGNPVTMGRLPYWREWVTCVTAESLSWLDGKVVGQQERERALGICRLETILRSTLEMIGKVTILVTEEGSERCRVVREEMMRDGAVKVQRWCQSIVDIPFAGRRALCEIGMPLMEARVDLEVARRLMKRGYQCVGNWNVALVGQMEQMVENLVQHFATEGTDGDVLTDDSLRTWSQEIMDGMILLKKAAMSKKECDEAFLLDGARAVSAAIERLLQKMIPIEEIAIDEISSDEELEELKTDDHVSDGGHSHEEIEDLKRQNEHLAKELDAIKSLHVLHLGEADNLRKENLLQKSKILDLEDKLKCSIHAEEEKKHAALQLQSWLERSKMMHQELVCEHASLKDSSERMLESMKKKLDSVIKERSSLETKVHNLTEQLDEALMIPQVSLNITVVNPDVLQEMEVKESKLREATMELQNTKRSLRIVERVDEMAHDSMMRREREALLLVLKRWKDMALYKSKLRMACSKFAISQGHKSVSKAFDDLRQAVSISKRIHTIAENRIKASKSHIISHWSSWTTKMKCVDAMIASQTLRTKQNALNQWLLYLHGIQEDREKSSHAECWHDTFSMKQTFKNWRKVIDSEKMDFYHAENDLRKRLHDQSLIWALETWRTFAQSERNKRHEEDAIEAAGKAVFQTSYKSKVIRALLYNKSQRIRSSIAGNAMRESWEKAAVQTAFSAWKSAAKESVTEIDHLIPQVRDACIYISKLQDQLEANSKHADDLFDARTDHYKRSIFSEWRLGVHFQYHQSLQSQMSLLNNRLDRMMLKYYLSKWIAFVRESQVGKLSKQIEFKDGKMNQLDQSNRALEQTIEVLRIEHVSVQKEHIELSKSHCLEIQRLSEERDALLEEMKKSSSISIKRDQSLQKMSEDYQIAQDEYTAKIHSLENRIDKLESELKRAELRLRSADSVKDSAIQRAQEAESKFLQTVQFAQSAQEDATNLKKSLEKSKSDARAFADKNMKQIEEIVMRKVSECAIHQANRVATH